MRAFDRQGGAVLLEVPAPIAAVMGIARSSCASRIARARGVAADLVPVFPEYDFSGASAGPIHVVVEDVETADGSGMPSHTRSRSGIRFGTVMAPSGPRAGRHPGPSPWQDAVSLDAGVGVVR